MTEESFADKISSILCSAPASFDPEDDLNQETVARVVGEKFEFQNDETLSSLRTRNAPLLDHDDKRYMGKKSSRSKIFGNDDNDEEIDREVTKSDYSEESSNEYSGNEEDQTIEGKSDDENDEIDEDSKVEDDEDSEVEDDEDSEVEDDEDDLSEEGLEQQSAKLKVMDLSGQISKGESVRHQLKMWENLLEVRIQLQKCLLASNKLPQGDLFNELKQSGDSKLAEVHNSTVNSVTNLLNDLLKLQSLVVKKYPETKTLLSGDKRVDKSEKEDEDDEEIPSDTEEELEDEETEEMPRKKRKLNEYASEIAKRHSSYKKYRNSVIDKWNEKTRLASSSSTSTHAINSVVNYIEHILTEKETLIKKTQKRHSDYEIMGEDNSEESNPNIYDDTDFYHQLLREFIEVKSADITDPIQLSQQWVQLQSMRSKMKRKVDTSATKGRKIKYVVHQKLVNFIAPVNNSEWQEEAATNFYKNLFGKNCLEAAI